VGELTAQASKLSQPKNAVTLKSGTLKHQANSSNLPLSGSILQGLLFISGY